MHAVQMHIGSVWFSEMIFAIKSGAAVTGTSAAQQRVSGFSAEVVIDGDRELRLAYDADERARHSAVVGACRHGKRTIVDACGADIERHVERRVRHTTWQRCTQRLWLLQQR